jgi:hypothetical protein
LQQIAQEQLPSPPLFRPLLPLVAGELFRAGHETRKLTEVLFSVERKKSAARFFGCHYQ